jgi:hypothetical protein
MLSNFSNSSTTSFSNTFRGRLEMKALADILLFDQNYQSELESPNFTFLKSNLIYLTSFLKKTESANWIFFSWSFMFIKISIKINCFFDIHSFNNMIKKEN